MTRGFAGAALGLAVALVPAASHADAGAPRPFALDDVYGLVGLSSPQMARDGAHVLVVVRTADREHDRWLRRIDLIDRSGGARTIAAGGAGAPRWSPSGDRIAYLDDGGVWIAGADGAGAKRVTVATDRVVQFAWRPDGAALATVVVARPPERTGDAKFLDAYTVGNDAALARGPEPDAHLYLQPLDGSAARALGPARGTVTWGDAESTLSFTPDGTTLAYLWAPDALANDAVAARIRLVDVATGAQRDAGPRGNVRDPIFSPDGTWLAYAHSDGDGQIHPSEAFVMPARGGASRSVSHDADRTVRDLAWEPGAPAVLDYTAHDHGRSVLFRSTNGAPARPAGIGDEVLSGLDGAFAADGSFAFVSSSARHADEVLVRSPDGRVATISGYNPVAFAPATVAHLDYATTTGVRGDAIVTLPAGFARGDGKRYPLVVALHGGPTAAALDEFDALDQLFAARGWLVLEPNYRGSDDLGARYQAAVAGDKLRGPGADVDAAIAALRRWGVVDEKRIAVSGWSYGAGLTLWEIERHRDFRAAVAGAAVTDIAADYATADDIAADRALLGGSPLVGPRRAAAAAMSPITYADRVRTPLLLMTCRGDSRVSPAGVYEFYHALRDLGRPVQLVAYPIDGHFPADPVRRVDVYRRWIDFIAARFGT